MSVESHPRDGEFPASRFETIVGGRSLAVQSRSPVPLLLALIVRLVLADRIVTPWIMIDELIYSELAKNFADRGDFLLRDLGIHRSTTWRTRR